MINPKENVVVDLNGNVKINGKIYKVISLTDHPEKSLLQILCKKNEEIFSYQIKYKTPVLSYGVLNKSR
jgi:hypothetical protein